jgi:tetratricopeptide (TPR) repeat protein
MFNAGRYQELENWTRLLLERCPKSGFSWKVLGVTLQAQGKDALTALQKAAEFLPEDAQAHYNFGVALQYLGHHDRAVASYRRALEIKSDYVEAHCNLGVALKELGHLDDAVTSYRRALEIIPDLATVNRPGTRRRSEALNLGRNRRRHEQQAIHGRIQDRSGEASHRPGPLGT